MHLFPYFIFLHLLFQYALKTLRWRDEDYHVGTCVFLTPGTIMKLKARKDKNDEESDEVFKIYKLLYTR